MSTGVSRDAQRREINCRAVIETVVLAAKYTVAYLGVEPLRLPRPLSADTNFYDGIFAILLIFFFQNVNLGIH